MDGWLDGIGGGHADDFDGDRGQVGQNTVQVGGISNHAHELRCPWLAMDNGELVT